MPDEKAPERPIDGEYKEQPTALEVIPPKEVALSTQDPTEFLDRAVKQADALKRIIDMKKLAIYIGGGSKAHVLIDGWQTLMALNGVMAYTLETRQARCVAGECQVRKDCPGGRLTVHVVTQIRRVSDGVEMTKVEAECSQHESRWMRADDYAVLSMAQTRGVGKGCRQLFGWVMSLAGYNATPAEEMPGEPSGESEPPKPAPQPISESDKFLIQNAYKWHLGVTKEKRAKPETRDLSQKVIDQFADFMRGNGLSWERLWAAGAPHATEAKRILGVEEQTPAAKEAELPFNPEEVPA